MIPLIRRAIFALRCVTLALEEFIEDDSGGGIEVSRERVRVVADALQEAADSLQAKGELN